MLAVTGLLLFDGGDSRAQPGPPAVDLDLAYTAEAVGVVSGGVRRDVVYLDNVDATATIRSDSLSDWTGLTAFVYGLGNQGGTPSALVGDAQVTSNIEAPLAWRIYEAWLQQTLGTRASLLVGLYDLNSEFDVNRTGSLFLNSSHGIGAALGLSGRNGPSIFPVTSLAGRVRVRLGSSAYVQSTVMDGVPGRPSDPVGTIVHFGAGDGVLAAAEVGTYLGGSNSSPQAIVDRTMAVEAPTKIAVGGWAYSTDLPEWTSVNTGGAVQRTGGSRGLYVLAEGRLLQEPGTDTQGLSGFGRVGWANEQYNRFTRYVGAGLVYTGLIPGRDADQTGLAVATARNGAAYEAAQRRGGTSVTSAEGNLEATYAASVTSWLTVIGDVQYVFNPDTDPSLSNALVGGIRFTVTP